MMSGSIFVLLENMLCFFDENEVVKISFEKNFLEMFYFFCYGYNNMKRKNVIFEYFSA